MLTATGGNKKVGLRPLHGATRFRAKTEYIPGVRQLQGTRVGTARALESGSSTAAFPTPPALLQSTEPR
jgi:hypothetical protein